MHRDLIDESIVSLFASKSTIEFFFLLDFLASVVDDCCKISIALHSFGGTSEEKEQIPLT